MNIGVCDTDVQFTNNLEAPFAFSSIKINVLRSKELLMLLMVILFHMWQNKSTKTMPNYAPFPCLNFIASYSRRVFYDKAVFYMQQCKCSILHCG